MIYDILPVNNYIGNNSNTRFDFDFYIDLPEQLKVYLYDENSVKRELINNVDYSINEVGNKNGSYITFPVVGSNYSVLSNNQKLSLELDLSVEQITQYGNSSLLNLSSLEQSFDYLTRLIQILKRKIDLCVKVDECSDNTPQDLMEALVNHANASYKYMEQAKSYAVSSKEFCENANSFLDESQAIKESLTPLNEIPAKLECKANLTFDNAVPIQDYIDNAMVWSMPDYSNPITLAWNSDYTAPISGWVYITANSQSSGYVYLDINSVSFRVVCGGTSSVIMSALFMPVSKGDVVKAKGGTNTQEFRFYPMKGAN